MEGDGSRESGGRTELDARAKLNLFLDVLGRRADGYHEIDSVLAEIDLCDRVVLERANEISLTVEGGHAPADESNLAWRAAAALGVGARIHLVKRIPSGAGLGGGSSDAAAVLRGLNGLYDLGRTGRDLAEIGSKVGADVPFFLFGGIARCRGIGELVEPLENAPERRFLLLVPEIHVSTADVYRAWKPGLTATGHRANVFTEACLGYGSDNAPYYNALQAVAERLDPGLGGVRAHAERRFGIEFTMTGSGSAYFSEIGDNEFPRGEFVLEGGARARFWTVVSACGG